MILQNGRLVRGLELTVSWLSNLIGQLCLSSQQKHCFDSSQKAVWRSHELHCKDSCTWKSPAKFDTDCEPHSSAYTGNLIRIIIVRNKSYCRFIMRHLYSALFLVIVQASLGWLRPMDLPYEVKYFTQFIDHFNYGGQAGPNGTYQERYLVQGMPLVPLKSWMRSTDQMQQSKFHSLQFCCFLIPFAQHHEKNSHFIFIDCRVP